MTDTSGEAPPVRLESTPGAGETLRQEGTAVPMAGTAMPVTRWHLKNAAVEAVRWDGSEAVRDVLREWGADPDAFPGPPLRVWGARDGYAGALLGDWLVRDPTAGAARYVPGLFTAAFEAPAVPDAALVPVGELGALGVLLERTHQAITDATARIDAEVAKAVAAERERIRELADKVGAVCTGDEGTSCFFSALLAGEAPPDGPQPHGDGTDSASVKLGKVRELAGRWAVLAPAGDWGESAGATVAADCGREILAIIDGDEKPGGVPS